MLGSPAILAAVLTFVDFSDVLARLAALRPGWVVAALVVAALQTLLSAWRWRFTAGRLGVELSAPAAVREYWLAGFLNQVVPGGVVGDVTRAVRHARAGDVGRAGPRGENGAGRRAVHAVVLERLSGQVVVAAAALASAVVLLTPVPGWWVAAATAAALLGAVVVRSARGRATAAIAPGFRADAHRALLHRDAFPTQLATSSAVVGSYVTVYLIAARAVGVETPFPIMLPLVTPVLLAMLVPVSVAGWGVREGAAAAIWSATGLAAADGVAISVAYGLIVLASTLPGAVVLALDGFGGGVGAGPGAGREAGLRTGDAAPDDHRDRGRTTRPRPADGAAPASGSHPPARPRAGG